MIALYVYALADPSSPDIPRYIGLSSDVDSALEDELRQETRAAIVRELSRVFAEAGARR